MVTVYRGSLATCVIENVRGSYNLTLQVKSRINNLTMSETIAFAEVCLSNVMVTIVRDPEIFDLTDVRTFRTQNRCSYVKPVGKNQIPIGDLMRRRPDKRDCVGPRTTQSARIHDKLKRLWD